MGGRERVHPETPRKALCTVRTIAIEVRTGEVIYEAEEERKRVIQVTVDTETPRDTPKGNVYGSSLSNAEAAPCLVRRAPYSTMHRARWIDILGSQVSESSHSAFRIDEWVIKSSQKLWITPSRLHSL